MGFFSAAVSATHNNVKTSLRYYVYFTKPASFFIVLVSGHSFVNYVAVNTLVSYLTSRSNTSDLLTAVIMTNLQEGLASVLTVVVAHVADTLLGQVQMTTITSLSYFLGLLLLWVLNMTDNINYGTYMVVVVLIALGQAGREPTLKSSFSEQLRDLNQSQITDETQLEARTTFWWRIFRFVGAFFPIVILSFVFYPTWGFKFAICAAVMGSAFLIILFGSRFCRHKGLTESPLTTFLRVFIAAFRNRKLPYSEDPSNYYKNDFREQPLMPDIPYLRWLDKAAIVKASTISSEEQQEQETMWKLCSVTQVKDVKCLLRMSPMWASFIVYSLVSATGSTFFFEQSSKLNDQIYIGFTFTVPLTFFYFLQKISSSLVSTTYESVIPKSWSQGKKIGATKMRMGVGMICCCLCCVAAWKVESRRLNKLAEYTQEELENYNTDMSIMILAPQFCLLGLTEGLAEDGLRDFFQFQVVESMRSYGPSFTEFMLGIGKFLTILCMLVFGCWFGDTIDNSQVNKYYGVLAIASLANIFIFSFVSEYVYKDFIGSDEAEEHGERVEEIQNSSQ